jgi:uncharacterized protein DUF5701
MTASASTPATAALSADATTTAQPADATTAETWSPDTTTPDTTTDTTTADAEFDRQVQALLDAGYPALAGLGEPAFRALFAPLRAQARRARASAAGRIPFTVVVTSALVTADVALPVVRWKSTTGWTEFSSDELAGFRPIPEVEVPDAPVYLIADVDTGEATLDVRAKDALPLILTSGRTPLTIDEGVTLLALFPGILKERNAFFLPGSRCGDKRVTALWISKGHPRLGWCWEGNPHTWLGSASAAGRHTS